MNRRMTLLALMCALATPAVTFAASKEESQAKVRQQARQILAAGYQVQPSARKAVESAAGYAAFSNFGMKVLVAGGGSEAGVDVNPTEGPVRRHCRLLTPAPHGNIDCGSFGLLCVAPRATVAV